MRADTHPEFVDFNIPFGGKLNPENRWVKLAGLVPWEAVEERYAAALAGTGMGARAMSGRIALGALIIKERLGVTDEEVVSQIHENPYLQHFLGYREMLKTPPFDPSMMVHFRSRFGQDDYDDINAEIIRMARAGAAECGDVSLAETETETESETESETDSGADSGADVPKCGKLLIDATATPADITYPTDLKLLNAAREKTEHIIDILHGPQVGIRKKPRTYRQKARRDFLAITKLKRPGAKRTRKGIGKQLRYLKRNLRHIDGLVEAGSSLGLLGRYDHGCLITIGEIYRQQLEMWTEKKHRIADRIVSLSQPWVRPIVRGKASAKTEFGAKISVGVAGGYCTLHRLSWDAYNECSDLIGQAESYRESYGHYPESIHADKIYRTRANRAWCKEKGIRLSGPPLGRPPKEAGENAAEQAAAKKLSRQDEIDRNGVEGKFGNAKRKGTLGKVMAKLKHTSLSVINVALIVLNLDTRLREVLLWLWTKLAETGHRPPGRQGGHQIKQALPRATS